MNKFKLLSIILLFAAFNNTSFAEEKVECKDIKKYFKRMACFSKAAKNKIGSAVTSSKEKIVSSEETAKKEVTPTSETEEPTPEKKIEKSKEEEKVKCEDIKKYFKRMACFSKAAKNKIGSAMTSSKDGVNKVFKKDK